MDRPSRSRRRWLAVVVATVLAIAGCGESEDPRGADDPGTTVPATTGDTAAPGATGPPATGGVPVPDPPYAVGRAALTFEMPIDELPVDELPAEDPPPEDGSERDGAERGAVQPIPGTIYYPAPGAAGGEVKQNTSVLRGRAWPLVVLSPDLAVAVASYEPFLVDVAAQGFVVVAPDLEATEARAEVESVDASEAEPSPLEEAAPGEPVEGESDGAQIAARASQLAFVADEMLDVARRPGHVLEGRIDPGGVGVLGQGLGADVALALVHTCCGDAEVRAVVAIGPSGAAADGTAPFDPAGAWVATPPPVLVVGEEEAPDALAVFEVLGAPKVLVTIPLVDAAAEAGAAGREIQALVTELFGSALGGQALDASFGSTQAVSVVDVTVVP